MIATSYITWANGKTTRRDVNMDDTQARRRFAHVARAALEEGGTVTTVKKGLAPQFPSPSYRGMVQNTNEDEI